MKNSDEHIVVRKEATWNGVHAELVRRPNLGRQEISFCTDAHSIFLNVKGAARNGESYLDGRRTSFVARPEGSLTYMPPGCTWTGWDEGDALASYLLISVEKDFAGDLLGELQRTERLRPEFGFKDLSLQFATRKIASEIRQEDGVSSMMVEGYITTIFGQLLRRSAPPRGSWRGGLAPKGLRVALETIESAIDRKLSLFELSREAGVSAEHFCRAFKRSTGFSPHVYLNRQRLQRASDLLRETGLSITEIAFMCGYSSASHLSTSFRHAVGVSPLVYRSTWNE